MYGSVRPWSQAANHLLVADATGRSAVIKFALDRRTGVFGATAGYLVLTNFAYHTGFDYMARNCRRSREATQTAEAGSDALLSLRTHDAGGPQEKDGHVAGFFVSTWGVPRPDVEALGERWRLLLDALAAKES